MIADEILRALVERLEENFKGGANFTDACDEGCRFYLHDGTTRHSPFCPYWQARRYFDGIGR